MTGLATAPTSAKLRLFVTDDSPDGGSVFKVGNTWTETGINWANAPAIAGSSLAAAGATTNGTWVDFDVTSAVTGNGEVSFALTTTSSNSSYYSSREGANRPQLVLVGGEAPAALTARGLETQGIALRSTSLATVKAYCPLPPSRLGTLAA